MAPLALFPHPRYYSSPPPPPPPPPPLFSSVFPYAPNLIFTTCCPLTLSPLSQSHSPFFSSHELFSISHILTPLLLHVPPVHAFTALLHSSCALPLASPPSDRLVGLVVRRPPRERKIPGSNPACAGIFSGSSHTSDLKIGIPVATLPGAWRYRVSPGTGRPGVSIL